MPYQRSAYPLVPMPAPGNPMLSLADLMQMAASGQRMNASSQQAEDLRNDRASKQLVEQAYTDSQGDLDRTIQTLEAGHNYLEASQVRGKREEFRLAQQKGLEQHLKTNKESWDTVGRALQSVQEAPEEYKSPRFAQARADVVKLLPNFDSIIPRRYEDDPTFVTSAIARASSVSELAARQHAVVVEANEALRGKLTQAQIDTHLLKHTLEPFLAGAHTGEDVDQQLTFAEKAYGASPAVRQRLGEIPTGELTDEWRKAAITRVKTEPATEPRTFDADIIAADRNGDDAEVKRLLELKARAAGAGREPDTVKLTAILARKAEAARWKATQLSALEERYRLSQTNPNQRPMTPDDLERAKAQIQKGYLDQLGVESPTGTPEAPAPAPKKSQSLPTTGLLTPGTITNLYDRPVLKNPDGSMSTTSSASWTFDGKEVLLPTVVNGKRLTDKEAQDRYKKTGEHLGIFDTPAHADAYAKALHEKQAAAPEFQARRLIDEIKSLEASGKDATPQRTRLAALRAQAGR